MFDAKRILLVTGRRSYEVCGAKALIEPALTGCHITHFFEFEVNPKVKDGVRGAELAIENNIDLILAVGGGSPMDIAKLTLAFLPDIENAKAITRGDVVVQDAGIPLICIPTTAGSGSEATHFAVAYIGKEKFSVASEFLSPVATILDGQLLETASPYQRAVNGLDAMAQAIEGCWARKSTPGSRENAFKAIRLLKRSLVTAVNSNEPEHLQNVMIAANLAGQVINISKTTAPHAFSYSFTSHYNVPHGHAVWLTLPAVFQRHFLEAQTLKTKANQNQEFVQLMEKLADILDVPSAEKAKTTLKVFMEKIGVEPEMHNIGANSTDSRREMASKVNIERLRNNPVDLSESDIANIFDF